MTSKLYDADMSHKERLTVYLDPAVAQALRVSAARRGMKDSDVVEEALRNALLFTLFDPASDRGSDLTEEEAMELAVREQHAAREERRGREGRAAS